MKHTAAALVISLLAAIAAAAQMQYAPCLVDAQRYAEPLRNKNGTPVFPIGPRPAPVWQTPKGLPIVYKIGAGASWQIPIVMPVAGSCKGGFESHDDRPDLAVVITDALGRYIRQQPPGDIEILILDEFNFTQRLRGLSYAAFYSSGRQFSGKFSVPLAAGYYRLVISNTHSFLAGKEVTFLLGDLFEEKL
jgi:hypothetical protein